MPSITIDRQRLQRIAERKVKEENSNILVCPISGMTEQQSHELSRAMVEAILNRDYSKPFNFVEA